MRLDCNDANDSRVLEWCDVVSDYSGEDLPPGMPVRWIDTARDEIGVAVTDINGRFTYQDGKMVIAVVPLRVRIRVRAGAPPFVLSAILRKSRVEVAA